MVATLPPVRARVTRRQRYRVEYVHSQRWHEPVAALPHLVETGEADAYWVDVRPKRDGELTNGKKTKVRGMRFDLQSDHWLIA